MIRLRKVTAWKRLNRFGRYAHNHIEDGHSEIHKPKLECVNPDKNKWRKEHGFLNPKSKFIPK